MSGNYGAVAKAVGLLPVNFVTICLVPVLERQRSYEFLQKNPALLYLLHRVSGWFRVGLKGPLLYPNQIPPSTVQMTNLLFHQSPVPHRFVCRIDAANGKEGTIHRLAMLCSDTCGYLHYFVSFG